MCAQKAHVAFFGMHSPTYCSGHRVLDCEPIHQLKSVMRDIICFLRPAMHDFLYLILPYQFMFVSRKYKYRQSVSFSKVGLRKGAVGVFDRCVTLVEGVCGWTRDVIRLERVQR